MDKFKKTLVGRGFGRFTSRYKVFFDGLPFVVSLFVGAFFLSRFTRKRYIKDFLYPPTKEELLAAGINMETDLASEKLEEELMEMKKNIDMDNWKNIPMSK